MRIPSGVIDQFIYFIAVDSTDLKTRETGLTSFTVYRSRDGGTSTAMTTPTATEVDATNMPGVYKLLLDEDMTLAAGNDSEEILFHITQASMAPVDRTIEIYRRAVTSGNTLGIAADGDISGNVDGNVVGSVATLINFPTIPANWLTATGIAANALNGKGDWNIGKGGYALTQVFPANFADLAIAITTGKVIVGTNDDKNGYSISGTISTLDGLNNVSEAQINTQCDIAIGDAALATAASLAIVEAVANAISIDTSVTLENHLVDIKGGAFAGATDSLQALRDRGDVAWITGAGGSAPSVIDIRTEMDSNSTKLAAIVAEIGSAGAGLTDLGGMSTAMKAQVNTEADAALADYNGSTKTEATANKDEIITYLPAPVLKGVADSGTTTTFVDAILAQVDAGHFIGSWVVFTSAALQHQTRLITAFDPVGNEITFAPATTRAVSTHNYTIIPAADLLRAINVTTNDDMRGTNSAALANVATEARLSELDAGTNGKMANQVDIIQTDASLIKYQDQTVYIDTEQLSVGDGSARAPFNTIGDGLDFAENNSIRQIVFLANATLDRNLKNFRVDGLGLSVLDLNGNDVSSTAFERILMTGHNTGIGFWSMLVGGFQDGLSGVLGGHINVNITGEVTLAANGASLFTNLVPAHVPTLPIPALIMPTGAFHKSVLSNLSGDLLLKGFDSVLHDMNIAMNGGILTIDSSCSAGVIAVTGTGKVINNATGTSVNIGGMVEDLVWEKIL